MRRHSSSLRRSGAARVVSCNVCIGTSLVVDAAGWGAGVGGSVHTNVPSAVRMNSRLPKRIRVPGAQAVADELAIETEAKERTGGSQMSVF